VNLLAEGSITNPYVAVKMNLEAGRYPKARGDVGHCGNHASI
jgi:hypothetical protein